MNENTSGLFVFILMSKDQYFHRFDVYQEELCYLRVSEIWY